MKSQAHKTFYKSLFNNMVDGLAYCQMIFDKNGNPIDFVYLKVNKNFQKQTGLKEVIGKKATKIVPGIKASNPELFEIYGQVSINGVPRRFETYIEPLSKWFFVSVYSPKRKFFVIVFQNITDRKQIEKNLENAKIAAQNVLEDLSIEKSKVEMERAKEEAILLSVGDGLLATDEKGNITIINKTAEKLLGNKREELIGKNFTEVIYLEDENGLPIPNEKRPIIMALATGITTSTTTTGTTYYYVRKDKARFPVAITVTPVVLGGKVIGAIEVFRDITREKEIGKAKTEFVSLASHQLRTPLSSVNWYAEMLLAGDAGTLNDKQKKYLGEVYKGNQRMVTLVNALLNVSRLELGTFAVEPEPTDVVMLMQSVVDEQKLQINERKIELSPLFEKGIPPIQADPKILRIVFQNLLSNAIKFTPDKGKVKLDLRLIKQGETIEKQKTEEESIAIIVSDTGYGIPKCQHDKIFSKLFRADNVREKDTEGTGLGLYIVKSIIDHSGGRIWFESEEDKGATFYVTLPLSGMKKKEGIKMLE